MSTEIKTPEDYVQQLPEDRKKALQALRQTIISNLP